MSTPDLINGCFELFGGFFILFSIVKLHKEKVVRGVSWVHLSFFLLWGCWNLYYYPHLNQWISAAGGVVIVLTNLVYCSQLVYYSRDCCGQVWSYDRPRPRLCVDLLVFRNWRAGDKGELEILLVKRGEQPFAGEWCVPGGRVLNREQPSEAVYRKLDEESRLRPSVEPTLFESHSDICDDPRGWFISNLYIVPVDANALPIAGNTEAEIRFFSVDELPEMVDGFKPIVQRAFRRLRKSKGYDG